MDLFDYMKEKVQENESPLASRLRPRTLDEIVGQQHIIGKGRLLYRAILADKLSSVIFYGGKPVIYEVDCERMTADGFKFYLSANHVWLTKVVPKEYLRKGVI